MTAAFHLGPLTIHWYGIMLAIAVITVISLGFKEAGRRGQSSEHVINMALFVLPLGIIGARLYQAIDKWDFYSQNPALILGGNGLGIFGAVIGVFLGSSLKKLSTLRWLDILARGHPWTGNRQMG